MIWIMFWLATAAMAALAVAFVLVPLLRARPATGPSETDANLEVLRGHRREIEADIIAGTLPADARDEALAELVGRAADDLASPPPPPAASARRPWPLAAALALGVPALAFAIYAAIGSPNALAAQVAASHSPQMDDKQIVGMVESLAAKMKERPEDAKGWALLARSMASLQRFAESAEAYERLLKLVPPDAQVLADYADVLGMAQGRKLAGRPAELAREALKLDPRHPKALALAATAAMEAGRFEESLEHWRAIAVQMPAGSPEAEEIDRVIDDVRRQAAAAGKAVGERPVLRPPAAVAAQPAVQPAPQKAASGAGLVSGLVALAPGLNSQIKGDETVFVLARAEGAPRGPPLAVIRATARELPLAFSMDDSNAMAPGMNISSAGAVRIEARVSRSGEVMQRSGDLVGASAPVKPGSRGVEVLVDKVLP